jgi:hypothetical protein
MPPDRAGLELLEPVRVERRSREQLESYLRFKLDEEMPEQEALWIAESYERLGLFPPDLDLRSILLSVYTEQVAGFYDPDSTALFVLDDQPPEVLQPLLVHELVHAVQDQATDLDSLTAKERGNDRQSAAQAVIEGHATLVMLEYMTEQLQGAPVDFATLPDLAEQMRPALSTMVGQFPALAEAPLLLQESLLFPYLEGAGFVGAVWRDRENRAAPFGELLPQSTEQVIDPRRRLSDPPDAPTELSIQLAGEGRVLYSNSLGQLEVGVLLHEHLGESLRGAAVGWDGDRYALVESQEGRGLIWVSVWDDVPARDRFFEALQGAEFITNGSARWTRLEIEDRPGAQLTLGGAVAAESVTVRILPEG